MKTPRTIQTKRTRPKAGFRMLHAATRLTKKRKQRAATTAAPDDLGEVPGVGVARALIVILLLHVAAIAGIYLHERWSSGNDIEATIPALQENERPTRRPELRPYTVNVGDDYDSIAMAAGVDRDLLVKVNEGKTLKAGWIINLPNRRAEEARAPEMIAQNVTPAPVPRPVYSQNPRPHVQTSDTEIYEGSRPGELVPVEGTQPEPSAQAILLKPKKPPVQSTPPRRRKVQQPAPQPRARPVASQRRHTVRAGETLWRIATNNGVTVDALQRANPGVNVKAMRIGTTLVIPSKR